MKHGVSRVHHAFSLPVYVHALGCVRAHSRTRVLVHDLVPRLGGHVFFGAQVLPRFAGILARGFSSVVFSRGFSPSRNFLHELSSIYKRLLLSMQRSLHGFPAFEIEKGRYDFSSSRDFFLNPWNLNWKFLFLFLLYVEYIYFGKKSSDKFSFFIKFLLSIIYQVTKFR